MLVDRTPSQAGLATQRHEHRVEMPVLHGLRRASMRQMRQMRRMRFDNDKGPEDLPPSAVRYPRRQYQQEHRAMRAMPRSDFLYSSSYTINVAPSSRRAETISEHPQLTTAEAKMGSLVNVEDFRRLAQARLPKMVFDYMEGGAEGESGLRHNRDVFEKSASNLSA